MSTCLLMAVGWVLMAFVTLPIAWKVWGRPEPVFKMTHLLWVWPGVLLILLLAWVMDLAGENQSDFSDNRHD